MLPTKLLVHLDATASKHSEASTLKRLPPGTHSGQLETDIVFYTATLLDGVSTTKILFTHTFPESGVGSWSHSVTVRSHSTSEWRR